jgi:MFS family permease
MSSPAAAPLARREFLTLLGLLTVTHTLGTVSVFTLAAVSPVAAEAYGVPVYMIGYQSSLIALGIVIALVFGGNLSLRWGATRVNHAGLVLLASGAALATVPSVATLIPASVSMGIGYGALTPSASHMLFRFTPAHRVNVVFSLKQSGVPLGGVLAATIMPALTLFAGWQAGLWLDAAAAIVMALLLERWRPHWDNDRDPSTPLAANPFGAMAIVWRRPSLRLMAFAGACIVAAQVCLQSYTVPMFYEQFAMSLVEAGLILTVSQAGGVFGRPFWGWLADRWRDCLTVLALLTATLVLATFAVGTLSLGWPKTLIYVLFFIFGATASGWNGAFLGEVARLAPLGQVSPATGGSLFFVNVSSIAAPIAFANIFAATQSYSLSFALLTLTSVAAIFCLLCARRFSEPPTGPVMQTGEKKPQS